MDPTGQGLNLGLPMHRETALALSVRLIVAEELEVVLLFLGTRLLRLLEDTWEATREFHGQLI